MSREADDLEDCIDPVPLHEAAAVETAFDEMFRALGAIRETLQRLIDHESAECSTK